MARESLLVVITVQLEVILVLSGELGHHVVDVLHATGACTHSLRREVGVAARAIPVLEKLRSERDVDVEVLCNASENITRHPKVVANRNAFTRADLVFPLAWHDLSVGTRNFDTSIEASLVVGISNSTTEAISSANRAVVRALRTGVTILGPAKRPGRELSLGADKSVLLLDTEPRLLVCRIEDFLSVNAEVGVSGDEILASCISPSVGVAHDKEVLASAERIAEDRDGAKDDLRVVGGSLIARRAIIVPLRDLVDRLDATFDSSALGAEGDATAVNPNILADSGVFDFGPAASDVDVLVVEGKVSVIGHLVLKKI